MTSLRILALAALSMTLVSAQRPLGPKDCANGGLYKLRPESTNEYYCDCTEAFGRSAFAGHLCEHSAKHYCEYGAGVSTYAFCVNDGTCKETISSGQEHPGCYCSDLFEGPHCEYAVGTAPDWALTTRMGVMTGGTGSLRNSSQGSSPANSRKLGTGPIIGIVLACIAAFAVIAILATKTIRRTRRGGVEIVTFPEGEIEADGSVLQEVMSNPATPGSFPGDFPTHRSLEGGQSASKSQFPTTPEQLEADGSSTLPRDQGIFPGTFGGAQAVPSSPAATTVDAVAMSPESHLDADGSGTFVGETGTPGKPSLTSPAPGAAANNDVDPFSHATYTLPEGEDESSRFDDDSAVPGGRPTPTNNAAPGELI